MVVSRYYLSEHYPLKEKKMLIHPHNQESEQTLFCNLDFSSPQTHQSQDDATSYFNMVRSVMYATKGGLVSRNAESKNTKGASRRHASLFRGSVLQLSHPLEQRVIIKGRVVKNKDKGKNIKSHLRYINREGVGIEGEDAVLFNNEENIGEQESEAWVKQCADDRHHFRFIISPENASHLDLNHYTKMLMERFSHDVNSKLQWLAVAHYDTDNPHVHLMVRGVDERGQDLIISRDYMAFGFRAAAQKIATQELGYRTSLDIELQFKSELTKDYFTRLDAQLIQLQTTSPYQFIDVRKPAPLGYEIAQRIRKHRYERLIHLEKLSLATELRPGIWQVDSELQAKLKALALQKDIIKTLHAHMIKGFHLEALTIFDVQKPLPQPLLGIVIDKGLSDELYERKYVVVAAENNKTYYIHLATSSELQHKRCKPGSIISFCADANNTGLHQPVVKLNLLSYHSLAEQIHAMGPNWLDEKLIELQQKEKTYDEVSFINHQIKDALEQRRQILSDRGIIKNNQLPLHAINEMYLKDKETVIKKLAVDYGNPIELQSLNRAQGYVSDFIWLSSGLHAVIKHKEGFSLILANDALANLPIGHKLALTQHKKNTNSWEPNYKQVNVTIELSLSRKFK